MCAHHCTAAQTSTPVTLQNPPYPNERDSHLYACPWYKIFNANQSKADCQTVALAFTIDMFFFFHTLNALSSIF